MYFNISLIKLILKFAEVELSWTVSASAVVQNR